MNLSEMVTPQNKLKIYCLGSLNSKDNFNSTQSKEVNTSNLVTLRNA